MKKSVMLVAGEASGDKHGAEIARRLMERDSDIHCNGMGSKAMRDAGVELLIDSSNIAVVGLFEVLAHWREIQSALKTLQQALLANPPDLLLLIDYQEFNLKLATFAKTQGIKVLFYVSPQVWAWRSGRVKKIGKAIDMMAVIFPFEEDFYKQHNVPVRYVGHPLTDKVKSSVTKAQAVEQFGLQPGNPVVALLPGSRRGEISRLLPIIAEAAIKIQQAVPNVQFLLPVAGSLSMDFVRQQLSPFPAVQIKLIEGRSYDVAGCSDAAIVASGTATLEVALLHVPMAIVYRVSGLSYAIFKRLIKVKHVGLANIVAEQEVAREFIQNNAKPRLIAEEIIKILNDSEYRTGLQKKLQTVTHKLGAIDGLQGITDLAMEMLPH